jgi:predicted HicB family RNase H-like nuclease
MTTEFLKRLIVHVHPTRHTMVKVLAAQRGISMSELVNQLLDAELKRVQ